MPEKIRVFVYKLFLLLTVNLGNLIAAVSRSFTVNLFQALGINPLFPVIYAIFAPQQ
jgi:hypothetical protein